MPTKKKIRTFFIESLGCAKNTVDAHAMASVLTRSGYQAVSQASQADVIIVNTCGFIRPAQKESVQVLNDYAQDKKAGQWLIAAGCLSERERDKLAQKVPGLDGALSTRRWVDIVKVFRQLENNTGSPYFYFPPTDSIVPAQDGTPAIAVQGKSAYLKIADGCDRRCAFCAIPLIKGPMVSRSASDIYHDASLLQEIDVKEIILIAQDSTVYGRDLGLEDGLPDLLEGLARQVPDVPWIRLMYTFPGSISERLIAVIRDQPQVLPYLDIPLQHAHPQVLKRMRRPSDMGQVRETLGRMKDIIPTLALRTTFIVGFPGETQEEFAALTEFVKEVRFDHVGIFPYYHEEGTSSFAMGDDVPDAVKTARVETLARLQEDISLEKNRAWIGRTMDVLIEGNGDGISIGRSYRDAPEIDGLVFLQQIIEPGEMVNAHITGALIHDLIGVAQ